MARDRANQSDQKVEDTQTNKRKTERTALSQQMATGLSKATKTSKTNKQADYR